MLHTDNDTMHIMCCVNNKVWLLATVNTQEHSFFTPPCGMYTVHKYTCTVVYSCGKI